jgi:DnaJ homolog subfamily C member 19
MVIVIAAVLSLVAFVVLSRLLWQSQRPSGYAGAVVLAAAVLVLGLAVLAASGRLHWLVAAGAAAFPFLRRGLGLLRSLPVVGALFNRFRTGPGAGQQRPAAPGGVMTRSQALDILGLSGQPDRNQVVAAHRRLIQKLHPDRGGSTYLAQQLNEAKQRLLDEL